ncbi:uncharacterized protein LOC113037565 [Astatotilapia calliptera]|uniref:uncharacterized protein LOC113037565 n=1 Tax=Astatotilapia calliptera TaxID=8154 RepID=UPI000E401EDB|nr:uncharacterized protein LOC113037565 [Astatotilapia calliptera]
MSYVVKKEQLSNIKLSQLDVDMMLLCLIKEAKPESDRLSLSANCSLVIKKVTDQDVGRYICRQYKTATAQQEGPDSEIHLSVINNEDVKMTKSTTVKFTTRTLPTTKSIASTVTLKIANIWTTREEIKRSEETLATINQDIDTHQTKQQPAPDFLYLLRCIIVSVGLAALLISAVTVNMWIKCNGSKTQMEKTTEHNDEGEDGVNYENIGDSSASVRLH